ncbi:unnamed protein product [Callosobruchus maculatus]|uniref:Telomerase reverse transcriptase n=1 Tax=Callosobruchus maculatus TaxID=64391 RepID=A0A653DA62_CALMS|nr:unnamed protein product [Callosobruchus maculatus]
MCNVSRELVFSRFNSQISLMEYYKLCLLGDSDRNKVLTEMQQRKGISKSLGNLIESFLYNLRRIRRSDQYELEDLKIEEILNKIIANDFFGSIKNRKKFYRVVEKITTQSFDECIYRKELWQDYDLHMEWLDHKLPTPLKVQLANGHYYILELIVKPLILTYYKPIKTPKSYQIEFIRRSAWQMFHRKVQNKLINLGYMSYSMEAVKTRGRLRLYPKGNLENLEFRALMIPNKTYMARRYYYRVLASKIKRIYTTGKELKGVYRGLFRKWNQYCLYFTKKYSPPAEDVYAIKMDIQDAFGNVNIEKLCDIINNSNLEQKIKVTLIDHVSNQYVLFDYTPVKWNHGLLQGDFLSSHLCELYVTVIEADIIGAIERPNIFLIRYVDEYFFCSTNIADVDDFERSIKHNFPINHRKTQRSNAGNPIITFCGHEFNIQNKTVSKSYNSQSVNRHRFRFLRFNTINSRLICDAPSLDDLHVDKSSHQLYIIAKAMQYRWNHHCFLFLKLSPHLKTERRLLLNTAEGMVYLAFKFHFATTAVDYCHKKYMKRLKGIVDGIIVFYGKKICEQIRKWRILVPFEYVLGICLKAFIVVLKKNPQYKDIVEYLAKKYSTLSLPKWHSKIFSKFPDKFKNVKMDRRSAI